VRLFVAVEIGEALVSAAAALVDQLRQRATQLAPRAKVTWIPPGRLHLTVRFIGHVDDAQQRAVAAVLEPRLDVRAFDLTLVGTGAFPPTGAPRVIWTGVAGGRERLQQLEHEVTLRLQEAGIPAEDRPYSPHLTLARVRDAQGLRSAALLERHRHVDLGAMRVEAITLFESRLSPKGPTYVALQQTPLRRS
jgi:2'-5' RNA ligase